MCFLSCSLDSVLTSYIWRWIFACINDLLRPPPSLCITYLILIFCICTLNIRPVFCYTWPCCTLHTDVVLYGFITCRYFSIYTLLLFLFLIVYRYFFDCLGQLVWTTSLCSFYVALPLKLFCYASIDHFDHSIVTNTSMAIYICISLSSFMGFSY